MILTCNENFTLWRHKKGFLQVFYEVFLDMFLVSSCGPRKPLGARESFISSAGLLNRDGLNHSALMVLAISSWGDYSGRIPMFVILRIAPI